jgi:hypothetical protein
MSSQRNFEDRLGQRIEQLDELQRTRSEKHDATLQHIQSHINCMASRLLNIAASMQNLEEKLSWTGEIGASDKRQPFPQQRDGTSPAIFKSGVTQSKACQTSETSDAVQVRNVDAIDTKIDGGAWKVPLLDTLPVNSLIEISSTMDKADHAQSYKMIPGDRDVANNVQPESQPEDSGALLELDMKFGKIDKKLERISASLGIKSGSNEGDDEEDRRRLKEKLKVAIEVDRRSRVLAIVSRSEVWLEYIFGICSPDQRIGKSGSR